MREARDPEFYIARLMTCSNEYRKFYIKRIQEMKEFESPLIFPESLLSIDQKFLWSAHIEYTIDNYHSFKVYIKRLELPKIVKLDNVFQYKDDCDFDITYNDIMLAEEDNPPFIIALYSLYGKKASVSVWEWTSIPYLFTNEKVAKEFTNKQIKKIKKLHFKINGRIN